MQLERVSFGYAAKPVFEDFSLTLAEGAITAVLGPSGVGKSTLIKLLSGLVAPTSGAVPTRKVSCMFQEPRLIPSLSVMRNLTVIPGIDRAEAARWLTAVDLADEFEAHPASLSGGMAQRVSMARAFAYPSDLLLMDEPFKGLDLSLRTRLYGVFLSLWRERSVTTVLVTHDPEEAVALSSRVLVLSGTPASVTFDRAVSDSDRAALYADLRAALMEA